MGMCRKVGGSGGNFFETGKMERARFSHVMKTVAIHMFCEPYATNSKKKCAQVTLLSAIPPTTSDLDPAQVKHTVSVSAASTMRE